MMYGTNWGDFGNGLIWMFFKSRHLMDILVTYFNIATYAFMSMFMQSLRPLNSTLCFLFY